jgi:uncharacterized protein
MTRVLVDICHPAHVHFFRRPIQLLTAAGHEIMVTSRDKEMALTLLDELGIKHRPISAQGKGGLVGLGRELFVRDWRLLKVAREFRPQVMAAIGGTFVAHVGMLLRIPARVFYDTENAGLQNAITYPFAEQVIVPRCYQAWTPRGKTLRYDGYHELSYLRAPQFQPSRDIALRNGLGAEGDTFLVRLVSWKANHDVGEKGVGVELLRRLVATLRERGKVLISAEGDLPEDLRALRFAGDPAQIHHLMAFCRGFVGESATMASECAVLGVPAIYVALTGRGYTDEQDSRYGLVRNVRTLDWPALHTGLEWLWSRPVAEVEAARKRLLDDTIDVAAFVATCLTDFAAARDAATVAR